MGRSGWMLILLLSVSVSSLAQFRNYGDQTPPPRAKRPQFDGELRKYYVGGGGGFGFGTGYNYYSLFPIVGYRITDDFSIGTGFTYTRYNYTYLAHSSFTQYGPMPFLRYNFNPLYIQGEVDFISAPSYDINGNLVRALHNRLLAGVGYASNRDTGMGFNILLAYDLLYTSSELGIYGSPVVVRFFVLF